MGARGPGRTPTAILDKRGSWLAKTRQDEPEPTLGIPKPTVTLKGKTKKQWVEHCERLSEAGILSQVDGAALERYCRALVKYNDLVAIDVDKIEIETPADLDVILRHTVTVMRLSEHLLKFEKEYGMTPSSRASVKRVDAKPAHGNAKDKTRFIDMNSVKRA